MLEKKIWANFQRIIEHFTQKIISNLSNIWVWVKKALDPRSRIRIRNTAKKRFQRIYNVPSLR
jgi:hypothetical protein